MMYQTTFKECWDFIFKLFLACALLLAAGHGWHAAGLWGIMVYGILYAVLAAGAAFMTSCVFYGIAAFGYQQSQANLILVEQTLKSQQGQAIIRALKGQ